MVRLTILGSGSGGNCALLATARTRILFDAGFSRRETRRRLALSGEELDGIAAIFVSHEHSDHVHGLARLSRETNAPVHLTERTHAALEGPALPRVEYFRAGECVQIGEFAVTPFTIPHDAADPVAFTVRAEGVKLCLVTDLGYLPENVKDQLREADCLMLESNHDLEMLKVGPYPWAVKQRVMSRVGHLSNGTAGEYLAGDFDGRARFLVLAHLSENNNLPELARINAEQALAARGVSPCLQIARQDQPLPAITL